MITFHLLYIGINGVKAVLNCRQQSCPSNPVGMHSILVVFVFFVLLRWRHKICDPGSCRELEVELFGEYFLFRVLIISPKFRLKTPSGLGYLSIESLGLFRGLFFEGG
jgi:hypothetical protein